jgi:hypothetical protein
MYSNAYMCRELTPLLNDVADPSDSELRSLIRDSESKMNLWLASKYSIPVLPNSYLTGTISVSKGDKMITGSGTSFTSLLPGQVIQITSTGEVLRVEAIESDTLSTSDSEAVITFSGSTFWIVPDELVTASKYLATHLTIMLYFSEKTINQDNVEKFDNRLKYFADDIIKQLQKGEYLNTSLVAQVASKGRGRLPRIASNDFKTANEDFVSEVLDF